MSVAPEQRPWNSSLIPPFKKTIHFTNMRPKLREAELHKDESWKQFSAYWRPQYGHMRQSWESALRSGDDGRRSGKQALKGI